jgi:hypothetical protein
VIVVATNVAETSLTIPGIRYVIDSGREKRKVYDRVTHSTKFEIGWISQASAAQRAGRAGRTGPGHCYRLYSSAVFQNQFPQYSTPEILCTPIDSVLLSMKNMNIESITTFPFPTPPDAQSVREALRTLTVLGALTTPEAEASGSSTARSKQAEQALGRAERITALGRTLAAFPVAPRFAKMLVLAQQSMCCCCLPLFSFVLPCLLSVSHLSFVVRCLRPCVAGGVLPYMVAIVAGMSVGELFMPTPRVGKRSDGTGGSDSDTDSDEAADSKSAKQKRKAEAQEKESEAVEMEDEAADGGEGEGEGDEDDRAAAAAARVERQRQRALQEEQKKAEKAAQEKERAARRDLQKRILAAKLKWTHRDSDLLTLLNVIGGFEYAEHTFRQSRAARKAAADSTPSSKRNSKKKSGKQQSNSGGASGDRKGDEEEEAEALEEELDADGSAVVGGSGAGSGFAFCQENFLRIKALREVQSLRRQLHHIINKIVTRAAAATSTTTTTTAAAAATTSKDSKDKASDAGEAQVQPAKAPPVPLLLAPPSAAQQLVLRQIVCAGLIDRVARKLSKEEVSFLVRQYNDAQAGVPQQQQSAAQKPRTDIHNNVLSSDLPVAKLSQAYHTLFASDHILIHPSSSVSLLHPIAATAAPPVSGSSSSSSSSGLGKSFGQSTGTAPGAAGGSGGALPEFVVYHELVRTGSAGRCYMRDVTCVEAEWISRSRCPLLCTYSKPLEDPAPKYDAKTDRVVAWVNVSFGHGEKLWNLPILKIPFPSPLSRIQHFCRLFLEGSVCPALLPFRVFYTAKPSSLLTLSESALSLIKKQRVTEAKAKSGKSAAAAAPASTKLISVLQVFVERDIDSKRKLADVWQKERDFLLREVLLWLQPSKHAQLKALWPPLK